MEAEGGDDGPGICGLLQPGLPIHFVPYVELGREPGRLLLRGTLVVRESCAKAD